MSSASKTTTSPQASGSARIKPEPAKAEGNTAASESKKVATAKKDDKSIEDANGGIITPHDHDVLSGRGNSVNHHPGNEYFRSLVRHHKLAYVRCPKPQKEQFSKLIVSTVRDREPPGRFLKQNPTTKLWYNIGTQKALDKTRQALREGAPATVAGLMLSQGLSPSHAAAAGLTPSQAVSTLSSVSGDSELIGNSAGGAAPNSSNHFLGHPHAHAAAVASQQQQHHLAAAAHSRMVNSSYYNAAAAAAAAGGMTNYPNSPKPPSGAAKEPTEAPSSNAAKGGQPPPQSPQPNPRLPPPASAPYPPPPAGSDEAMKYHAAQVVRMAAAAHTATGNGTSGSNGGSGSNFGPSAALAAAAGTFNPVLLEHIMAQHRGGSVPPPSDWNGRQPAPAAGGRDSYYPGYPPAPGSGQHEDIHAKCQRQEAYIAHLQERIQQQERQLLTLCSHILLSPPGPPPPGGAGSMGVNPSPPTTGSSSNPGATAGAAASSPLHNGIPHPQYAAAAKMNAATAVANINATAAAVKEIQSYANAGDRSRLAAAPGSKSPVPFSAAAPPIAAAVPAAADKSAKAAAAAATNGISAPAKDKAATTPAKSPALAQEKASDDGDAVAALLALGIGKSPTSSSPTAATAPAAGAPESEDSGASKKKRKQSGGRRTLPLKKKQIQQENSKAAAAATTYQQQLHSAQQQQHMPQVSAPRQNQAPQKALSINAMMMQPTSRAVAAKPPVDIGQAPELYLYGETPIHEPHVHVSHHCFFFYHSDGRNIAFFFLFYIHPNLTFDILFRLHTNCRMYCVVVGL